MDRHPRRLRLLTLAALASVIAPWPGPARAEGEEPTADDRIEAIDQKVRVLERLRELDAEKAKEAAKTGLLPAIGKDGFSLKSADGSFQIRFRGVFQTDANFFTKGRGATNTFTIRRARPIVEGTVSGLFDYRIVPDFGGGKALIQDCWVAGRFWPKVTLQFGKYKQPFGLERLMSAQNLFFVERGLPTMLAPNRDIGLQFGGSNPTAAWAIGAFNGVYDGGNIDADGDPAKDVTGRLFVYPFKTHGPVSFGGLGLGLAMSYGSQNGTLPSYKTAGQQTFFSYSKGAKAAGDHFRISPQAYFSSGRLGLLAEHVTSSQAVRDTTAIIYRRLRHEAWQLAATCLLTHDTASMNGVSPARPYGAKEGGGAGAWELAARYNTLRVDPETFAAWPVAPGTRLADPSKYARIARTWEVGLNWYCTRNARWMLNYERTTFTGGDGGGGNRNPETAILGRFQVAY